MNLETLERALDAIQAANRELILAEATEATLATLRDAYAGLSKATQAIAKLICKRKSKQV